MVHIDTQYLAQEGLQVLAVSVRIATRTAISQADVEVAVRTKGQAAAIVVCIGLVNVQQVHFAGRVSTVWVICRNVEARNDRIPVQVGVIDEEQFGP